MQLLDHGILFFKSRMPFQLLNELDYYFNGASLIREGFYAPLSEDTISKLNDFVKKEIQPEVFKYFIYLTHPERPDLMAYSGCMHTDVPYYDKHRKFRNTLEDNNSIEITDANALLVHRGSIIYDGNLVKWKGTLNKFTILIGISQPHEHDSNVNFPIQKVSIQLNRGDIIVAPAGITHPYILAGIINGKFKLIECL